MTIFESKASINKPVNDVYLFLADMNNHKQLMPESIIGWSSTVDEARFTIQNMSSLSLRIETRTENSEIKIVPLERPPFDLELKWTLLSVDNNTAAKLTISADLNMMMKMLASGPLQKLADHQTRSLAGIFG